MQSDVVITGYRLNAKEPAQKALERILGLGPEEARLLARSFPAVVLEGAANDNAERVRAQLESAGALVELRASQPRLERSPRDLPAPSGRGGAFDLDLDLPMAKGGAPAKANKGGGTGTFGMPRTGGTGSFAAPKTGTGAFPAPGKNGTGSFAAPKTGTGAFPAPGKNGTGAFAAPAKTGSLAIPAPPGARARASQPTGRGPRGSLPQPPPPPPAAYQLGDFGVAPRGQSVVAKLPSAPGSIPPPTSSAALPTLADGDFDFESAGGGGGLELDLGIAPRRSLERKPSQPRELEEPVHGERFGALAARGTGKAVEVDAQVMRSVERRPISRRPKKQPSALARLLDGPWLSVLTLLALAALTLAAVGYALDPSDPIGGLARAQALPQAEPADELAHQDGYLHPLLRNTPRALRAPVAAILRAQIPGVHDVPVEFATHGGETAQCAVVEHGADTQARLVRVRETGHEVAATGAASAQLIEHERALRSTLGRADLQFTRVCLAP